MSRYLNTEHIAMLAAFLWQQTGGDPDKAIERAITLQKKAFEKCEKLNKAQEEAEEKQRARAEYHDEGNATNHKRSQCRKEHCGLDPVL
jgi:hypothetical protein